MDFFESQDRARRKTWKLIVLYLISVVLMIVAVYLVVTMIFGSSLVSPGLFLAVSTIMIVMLLAGTLFRVAQLRGGGASVAQMLGGRKVNPSSTDAGEQKLINVVEEMSIASGVPVPDIYILDNEPSINAFAAGYNTNDAAIGVTMGCVERLSRDELQGVIAHEFSHIFNGDMRLNIRLIGILNGILLLHLMGMILMRSGAYSGMSRGRGQGNNAMPIILLGLSLLVIGYIGMLFGRMIQSAVSRQREYLADAAAVQYTRNPEGLAGALQKIAGAAEGGKINDGHAMELSHLFFASGFSSALDKLFATHPPIKERIEAIHPGFDSESVRRKERIKRQMESERVSRAPSKPGAGGAFGIQPEALLAAIGTIESEQIQNARSILDQVPAVLRESVHDPLGAETVVYGLLIAGQKKVTEELAIPEWIGEMADEKIIDELTRLYPHLSGIERAWYIPLIDMAMPALRSLSNEQYQTFRQIVEKLTHDDDRISLFEFALEKILVRRLDSSFSSRRETEIRHHHFKTLNTHIAVLLSALSYSSGRDAGESWRSGLKPIENLVDSLELLSPEECGLEQVDRALDELSASANPVKKYFLNAAIHCVIADKTITGDEAHLLRAISEALDCPLPMISPTLIH